MEGLPNSRVAWVIDKKALEIKRNFEARQPRGGSQMMA